MDGDLSHVDSHRNIRLAQKFHSKDYRDTYVESHSRRFLAHQMREFRGDASQTEFGRSIGRSQTIVSRLEDPNYSGWTTHTIFDVAKRLNVAAIVRFVDFPRFLQFTDDLSAAALKPTSYAETSVDQFVIDYAWSRQGAHILPTGNKWFSNVESTDSLTWSGSRTVSNLVTIPYQYNTTAWDLSNTQDCAALRQRYTELEDAIIKEKDKNRRLEMALLDYAANQRSTQQSAPFGRGLEGNYQVVAI